MRKQILGVVVLLLFACPLWANWGVVQQSQGSLAKNTTNSAQFAGSVTAGDLILVQINWNDATNSVVSVTDALGNTFSSAVGPAQQSSAESTQLFYAANVAGGTDRITVTMSGTTLINIFIYEITGAAATNPLDVTAVGSGSGTSVTTGSVATGGANEFVFVGIGNSSAAWDSTGAGFSGLQEHAFAFSEFETAATAGTAVKGVSTLSASSAWSAVLAAFHASSTSTTSGTASLTSIQVTPASPTLTFGQTLQFTATGTFSDASTQDLTSSVTWASSNTTVASINGTGGATAAGHGTTTITATSGSISGSTPLTVEGTLSSLQVTPTSPSLAAGTTQQLTATGTFTDGIAENLTASVGWTSSNTSVATVNASGLATAVAPGSATITATSSSYTSSAAMTVTQAVASGSMVQTPLVQTNYNWENTWYAQHPPTVGGSSCSPAPCIAQSFLNPNTAGNLILVWVSWNAGGFSLTSLTDSAGNTYVHIPGFPVSGNVVDDFWVAYNIAGSSNNKITGLFGSGTTEPIYMQVMEFSGLKTANALDVYSTTRQQNQCNAPCTLSSAPTPTTTQASELLVAVYDVGAGLLTAGNGWTPAATCFFCEGWGSNVSGEVLIEQKLVSATGSYTATITSATSGWPAYTAYVFTFRLGP
ncbi:MAG: Ig-like domain-containing protein [Acidobacteriia bacterium]|nr:Ig-like domain-containing protein [Terriglobia bacterium]